VSTRLTYDPADEFAPVWSRDDRQIVFSSSDYARRKGMTLAEAERWLSPSLAYEPQSEPALV